MRFLATATSLALAIALTSSNGAAQTPSQTPQPATGNGQPATVGGSTTSATGAAAPTPGAAAQGTSDASKAPTTSTPTGNATPKPTADTVAQQVKDVKAIKDALSADSDLDFSLVVGIASLIVVSGSTDYSDESNVIHSNNIGKATPQFLTGVAFRSHFANVLPRYWGCTWDQKAPVTPANSSTPTTSGTTAETPVQRAKDMPDTNPPPKTPRKNGSACGYAEPWQKRPWNAFVSVKFQPGASQTVNGFVFGVSYALTKYLNALVGFSLTPINEPAPGFRTTAAQFVTAQQKLGQDLNFNPTAMLNNSANAFDGFPVTDSTGKLIYSGNPLTVHYHGGAVFGVSIPIYFSSIFK